MYSVDPPEGHPGQFAYACVKCTLSTALTWLSTFSAYWISSSYSRCHNHRVNIGVELKYREWACTLSCGSYTATLYVMVIEWKGVGVHPLTFTSQGWSFHHDGMYARNRLLPLYMYTMWSQQIRFNWIPVYPICDNNLAEWSIHIYQRRSCVDAGGC